MFRKLTEEELLKTDGGNKNNQSFGKITEIKTFITDVLNTMVSKLK